MFFFTAGIPGEHALHAFDFLKNGLHTPETTAGQSGNFFPTHFSLP
jgi:hypothetical protein